MSALLFAVAEDMGVPCGLITPKAMARAIEMYGGEVKADAHDASVIAEVSASLPRPVKPVEGKSDACPAPAVLTSYGRELTEEAAGAGNRLHDPLLSTCPALEAHLGGKRIQSQFYLTVLARYSGCAGLKRAEGRSYGSAVTALARRRLNVMYAMLRDGKPYEKNNG